MAVIQERLTDFRIYKNGANLAGVADIQLPSFENLTETISGAGVAGEYESPIAGHFQSMKLSINWTTLNESVISAATPGGLSFDCRGANQVLDSATGEYKHVPVRVYVKGANVKNDPGKMEKNAKYESSTDIEVTYIKIDINGKNVIELDKLNYKYIVNGKDYLANVRKALGL